MKIDLNPANVANPTLPRIISTSWGYSMTLVDYAQIVRETAHKVECVMIGSREEATGFLSGQSYPDLTVIKSKPFMLCKRVDYEGKPSYVGQYPYANRSAEDNNTNKQKGHFSEYDIVANEGLYFNHCD